MKNNLLKSLIFSIVCFGFTTSMSAQAVIQVAEGNSLISVAMLEAFPGDIIELTTSGGMYPDTSKILIEFDITIRAAEGLEKKPVIMGNHSSDIFYLSNGGLTLQGVKLEGLYEGTATIDNMIEFKALTDPVTSSDFSLKIDNCEFHHFPKKAITNSSGTLVPLDSVIVTNSIFMNGNQGIYLKSTRTGSGIFPGAYKYALIENCLFAGLEYYPTYLEPGHREVADQGWPEVIVNHCTVDSCYSGIYTYTTSGAIVRNCVVSNLTADKSSFGVESGRFVGAPPSLVENCIYSHGNIYSGNDFSSTIIVNCDSVTATYTDAANGDYSLVAGTAGVAGATDGTDMGAIGLVADAPPAGPATLPVIWEPGFEADGALTDTFDTGGLIWDTWYENTNEINTDAAYVHSGSKSLKITAKGGRSQYVTGFTPGTTVSLLAWGKSEAVFTNLGHQPKLGIACYDAAGDRILEKEGSNKDPLGENYVETINPDGWSREVVSAVIPAEAVEMKIYVWCSWSDGDPVSYLDDFEMVFGDSTVVEQSTESIKEYNSPDVIVYSNPTMGQVHVAIEGNVAGASSLKIYDLTGRVVSSHSDLMGRRNIDIDLSSSPAGLYFGVLKTEDKTHSFKILKK